MENRSHTPQFIAHPGEPESNDWRKRAAQAEPRSLRTFTPTAAVIQQSQGAYHFTCEGRRLVDFTSGVLVANLGHNPTDWWERVLEYLGLNAVEASQPYVPCVPLTAYNAVTPLEVLASERLLENLRAQPGGGRMERVLWAASGSEAIQKALWCVMRREPRRDMVLATRYGFHGKKGLAGAVTGTEDDRERDPRVRFLTFPRNESRDVQASRQPPDLSGFAAELEQHARELGGRLCAVITEPYLGGGGSFHPHPSYLQLLEQFCRQHDLALILDEIQSCFGRTGPMYAFTRYGIEPDLVCLGKGMGNGVPVSAAVGRADLLDALDYGECSDTWSANPLSSAAVLATLDVFESEGILERGQKLAAVLERGLQRLTETGLVAAVRGEGCVWGVECAAFHSRTAAEVANACVKACYLGNERGQAIHLLGPLASCVLRVSPPLILAPEEAQTYLDVMYEIFQNLATGELAAGELAAGELANDNGQKPNR